LAPLASAWNSRDRLTAICTNPATAHLFIVNPLGGQMLAKLFSTHPPMEERIARLRAMRLGG